jgi:hypothetical protein
MADYYPLIARAVAGLENSTGDARRVLYERARAALVAQLRGVTPALDESDVTRERLALEEAIRKVEAEAARKPKAEAPRAPPIAKVRPPDPSRWEEASRWDQPPPAPEPAPPVAPRRTGAVALPAPPPPPVPSGQARPRPPVAGRLGRPRQNDDETDQAAPADNSAPAPPPSSGPEQSRPAPERRSLLDAGLKNFHGVVSEADELGEASARAAQSARDTFAAVPNPSSNHQHPDMQMLEPEQMSLPDLPAQRLHERSFRGDDSRPLPPHMRAQPSAEEEDEDEQRAPQRSFRDLMKIAVAVLILAGISGLMVWQWPNMVALYRYVRAPSTEVAVEAPAAPTRQKIPDRIEPGAQPGTAPGSAGAPATQPGAAVAQRVVLYEEDPADPAGKRFVGSAIWRTETVSPGPNQPPELAIRADVEIPDRKLAMTWSLRRNTDPGLPASHTIEIVFKLPTDFVGGTISNVPGVLMKQAEQTRGVPLAGLAVKVTNGFFLIGLSAVEADRERNVQLLKERAWFDIPVVYGNNRRAILALEKGTPGERAFAEAFNVWRQ